MNGKIIVIMGPTGSGKTSLALKLTDFINCEILSADSMQVYRGMDIGTAKAGTEEQKIVPHHMIDIMDINERLDIFSYVKSAQMVISDIFRKGKIAVIVGGSGLYIKSVLYGLDPLPSDPQLRDELDKEYKDNFEKLKKDVSVIDPKAFKEFELYPRKLIRAIEVYKLSGVSILDQHSEWDKNKLKYKNVYSFVLKMNRKKLFERIGTRTEKMLESGWIDETRKLIAEGLLESPTAKQAIGYPIIAKYIQGKINYDEMKMRIISSTKKYARRQETWFNHQHPEAKYIDVDHKDTNEIINEVLEHLNYDM